MDTERRDWNVFKQIFSEHWEAFQERHPRYASAYYDGVVRKMLDCGAPRAMGYQEYRCTDCGEGHRIVPMSCKSSFCLRCCKVYVDNWVETVSRHLHPGVVYRHIVLTVPEMYRLYFYRNAELHTPLFHCGVACLDDFFSTVSRRKLEGGYIVVFQTHGRNGQYNPHLHIIATSGGYDAEGEEWKALSYLPYPMLHKKWQWYLLEMLKRELATEEIRKAVDEGYRRYPNGFVANVQKGDVPSRCKSLAGYLAKYVVSPPISLRRIDRYDGKDVTYHYRSHKTDRTEYETVDVYTFIGRMIQHVLKKGFQRIRYYGVQATRKFQKIKTVIRQALRRAGKVIKDAVQIVGHVNYRERYKSGSGRDPLVCPFCGKEMILWKIWHPKYRILFDAVEEGQVVNERKREERADRKRGRSIRSASGGVQLSLFGVRA